MFNLRNLWRRKKPQQPQPQQKAPQSAFSRPVRVTPQVNHFSAPMAPASAPTVNSSGPDLMTMMMFHNLMHSDSHRGVETHSPSPQIEQPQCRDTGSSWDSSSYDSCSSSSSSSSDW